jgi:hypothetical protein
MPDGLCQKCGKLHTRCSGHKKGVRPWEPCMRWPRKGAKACRMHGGNAPAARAKAEREAVRLRYQTFGEPVPHNLAEGILEEIFWAKGHLKYLREQIRDLDPEMVVWGDAEYKSDEDGFSSTEKAGVNVWVKLYYEQVKIYLDLVRSAHAMGIEERRLQIAQQMGDQLLRFAGMLGDRIRLALVREGWAEEELTEVWLPIMSDSIAMALEAAKEEPR